MTWESTRFVTVSTRSHLAGVAVLAESLRRHHPEQRLTCYLVENEVRPSDTADGLMDVRSLDELSLPDRQTFLFQYTPGALCFALKPRAMLKTLAEEGVERVVYLDGDMYVSAPFIEALDEAWRTAAVLLTPHLLRPWRSSEGALFLAKGSYNAGFLAVRKGGAGSQFLSWFQDRLVRECVNDPLQGLFADQKWLDLAAASCPEVAPLRHPGINVGHWSLQDRDFSNEGGRVLVDGSVPLCIFHFSGFDPATLSVHRPQGAVPPAIAALAAEYARELTKWQKTFPGNIEWSFARFEDGTWIEKPMREVVRRQWVRCGDPFKEKARILSAVPAENPAVALSNRPEDYPERLALAEAQFKRLRNHPVIGLVWRLWARFVNPRLR